MLYAHLFEGRGCEAPACAHPNTSLYPTRQGLGLVRACNPIHARAVVELDAWLEARAEEAGEPEPEPCPECGEPALGRCPCEYRDYYPGEGLEEEREENER